jgi:hypothetical protein
MMDETRSMTRDEALRLSIDASLDRLVIYRDTHGPVVLIASEAGLLERKCRQYLAVICGEPVPEPALAFPDDFESAKSVILALLQAAPRAPEGWSGTGKWFDAVLAAHKIVTPPLED